MPEESPGLTEAERSVLVSLSDAWNAWVKLSGKHPNDDDEFRHAIHAAQNLVAFRVARRVDPDVWWTPKRE